MKTLHYYVYYKADLARAEELSGAVTSLFRLVHEKTGVHGQWQRRRDDARTFMEIYADIREADAFERALSAAENEVGIAPMVSDRVVEIFQCA